MGSATTHALAATTAALAGRSGVGMETADELFAVGRALTDSSHLTAALADPSASVASRVQVVDAVFGALSADARALVSAAVSERWSNASDLIDGIEDLAVRAAAKADAAADVEGELFAVSRVIAANPELELALGSRIGDATVKGQLVSRLLQGRTSAATGLIVSSLVRHPRERRVRQLIDRALRIVSDERGRTVATVVSATELTEAQQERLRVVLSRKYGRAVTLNTVVDPTVVGGLRVQVADDVIDASIAARLADLRQRLAG